MKKRILFFAIISTVCLSGIFAVNHYCKPKVIKGKISPWIPVDKILNFNVFEIEKPYLATQIIDPKPKHGKVVLHSTEKVIDISSLESNKKYYVRVWSDSICSKIQFIHKI